MRRLLPGLLVLPALAASAETVEESCRFAEALSDRMRWPDAALRYLEPRAAKAPEDKRTLVHATLLGLLESQIRLETDEAKRALLTRRAREVAKPTLDKLGPDSKAAAYGLDDFRIGLAFLRIERTAAMAGAEPGPTLKRIHLDLGRLYSVLQDTLFETQEEDYAKVDLMNQFEMYHGNTALLAKTAAGLNQAERLELLGTGHDKFSSARSDFDDESKPDLLGFPHASLGQAQCLLALSEVSGEGDPAAKKSLEEAKRILNQLVSNPMNPNLPASEILLMRYRAVQEILQISAREKDFGPVRSALGAFRAKAGTQGEGKDRAELLLARIDYEESRRPNHPKAKDLSAKAKEAVAAVKERGGQMAAEADALLVEWEGASGKAGGFPWKAEADKAFSAKNYPDAIRKYRAAIRTAARGEDAKIQNSWLFMALSLKQQQRTLEAIVAAERAARHNLSGANAAPAAVLAASIAQSLPYPPAAVKLVRKRCYQLLSGFKALPEGQLGAYLLGRIYMDDREYKSAEEQFALIQPDNAAYYPMAVYSLGRCRVRRLKALEREGKQDPALAQAAEDALAKFLEGGFKSKDLDPYRPEAAFLRAELNSRSNPGTALKILDGFAASYPDAKDLSADVPRLRSIALAAKGDFAGSEKAWNELNASLGAKPWPVSTALLLQKLCEGKAEGAGFKLALANQLLVKQPFALTKFAGLFDQNFKAGRWEDAVDVGEKILESTADNPAYEEDEVNAKWLNWLRTYALPKCYDMTQAWTKLASLVADEFDNRVIQGKYEPKDGTIPPRLRPEDLDLWEMTARASVRSAEAMPAGEARKATAERGAKAWRKRLEVIPDDKDEYWTGLLDTLRCEILAGQYQSAKERLHGKFITYPELGGQKDRFLQMLKDLPQAEPGFAETASAMLAELEGGDE